MNRKSNKNIIVAAAGAFMVAVVSAVLVAGPYQTGEATGPTGGATGYNREFAATAPIAREAAAAAREDVVATVAAQGTARVIVQLDPGMQAQDGIAGIARAQEDVLASVEGSYEVVDRLGQLPILVLEVDEAAASSLANSGAVVSMMVDRVGEAHVIESIPMIGAPNVYDLGYTGEGYSIAVLDTGVEATHRFFGDRVVHEVCFSSTYVEDGVSSLCPDGSSYAEGPGASNGCNGIDGCDHGTHVAGIIAGSDVDGNGVAPGANIIGIQVFSKFTGARCGGPQECVRTYTGDQLRAIQWVIENRERYNIAAVNMSLGGGLFDSQDACDAENAPFKAAFERLAAVNIPVVISAGNESSVDSLSAPACVSSAISVGSLTKGGEISYFSNSHPMLDILAPGSDIGSAYKGNVYGTMSGTSMASPHVAGAFALLRSAKPDATYSEMWNALVQGPAFEDPRNDIVRPMLRVDTAVSILLDGSSTDPNPNPYPTPAPTYGPDHDDQANARVISLPYYYDVVDVTGATVAQDDPYISPTWYCSEGGRYNNSVWYTFTAPSDGYLTISTAGSDYDTIVSVWQGDRSNPTQLGCNDDDWYPNLLTTTISGWVAAGTTFRIQVAAWDDGGTLAFSASFASRWASAGANGEGATFDDVEPSTNAIDRRGAATTQGCVAKSAGAMTQQRGCEAR